MPKEQFLYPETRPLFDSLEELSRRSGVSRGQAFEDFVTASVCSLAGGTMEDEYMAMVERHKDGPKGTRGIDVMPRMFGQLVEAMDNTRKDILGDLFQGAITYGEAGQYFTPESICQLMAKLTYDENATTVCDPCCGTGRMLLAAADEHRSREFIGQDVDLRCVRITAINLALRNLYGYVIWGNSLALENKLVYRTGFNGRGFVRKLAAHEPLPGPNDPTATSGPVEQTGPPSPPQSPAEQKFLF